MTLRKCVFQTQKDWPTYESTENVAAVKAVHVQAKWSPSTEGGGGLKLPSLTKNLFTCDKHIQKKNYFPPMEWRGIQHTHSYGVHPMPIGQTNEFSGILVEFLSYFALFLAVFLVLLIYFFIDYCFWFCVSVSFVCVHMLFLYFLKFWFVFTCLFVH